MPAAAEVGGRGDGVAPVESRGCVISSLSSPPLSGVWTPVTHPYPGAPECRGSENGCWSSWPSLWCADVDALEPCGHDDELRGVQVRVCSPQVSFQQPKVFNNGFYCLG